MRLFFFSLTRDRIRATDFVLQRIEEADIKGDILDDEDLNLDEEMQTKFVRELHALKKDAGLDEHVSVWPCLQNMQSIAVTCLNCWGIEFVIFMITMVLRALGMPHHYVKHFGRGNIIKLCR